MFRHGYIPKDWKCLIVALILKLNKPPGKGESYRPISLSSCLGKIMDRMINSRLKWHLNDMKTLPKVHPGFGRGCTTTDHLIRIESEIMSGLNKNRVTSAIFLDIAKAFGNAWTTGLLFKISQANVTGNTLRWLQNFLTGRSIKTRVDNNLSEAN